MCFEQGSQYKSISVMINNTAIVTGFLHKTTSLGHTPGDTRMRNGYTHNVLSTTHNHNVQMFKPMHKCVSRVHIGQTVNVNVV